jgi:serine/threonine protein kinase
MVNIELSDELVKIEHSRSGKFFIPEYIKLNTKKYNLISDLSDVESLPRGGFGMVIFYQNRSKKIAIKFINITKLQQMKGNSSVKKAKKEVNLLEELKNKFKKNTKCKNSIVNYIGNYYLDVNNYKYLLILLDKMDMDLSDFLLDIQNKKIELKTAKKIMLQITSSIKCLHQIGIIYNDMKPDNVLINMKSKNSKLTDFNCILKLEEENYENYEKEYTGCSTGSYRSPEQIDTAVSYDFKADSWQLGILFLCILQKSPRSFISLLAKKYETDRDTIIENLNHKMIDKQLEICKKEFRELNETEEYENLRSLIHGLLEQNPLNRFDIEQVFDSNFLKRTDTKKSKKSKKKNNISLKRTESQFFSNDL